MWKYGKDIIRHLFEKRGDRPTIRVVLESKGQALSDRSDIRVFEAGLSSERYGDNEQGTGNAAQDAESKRLIAIAKTHGLFVPKNKCAEYGDRKRLPSGESIVYLSNDGSTITKIRDPFSKASIKSLHAQDVIYEHLIHNILFPLTRYNFIGISEPSQKDIDDYLIYGLGLRLENKYFYANDYVAITDVSANGDNVLIDNGNLYFIDPIIKFKKPADETLNYYYDKIN